MGGTPFFGRFIIMKNPMKMDDLGGKATIFGNTHLQHPPFSCEFIREVVGIPHPSSSPLPCDPRRSSNPATDGMSWNGKFFLPQKMSMPLKKNSRTTKVPQTIAGGFSPTPFEKYDRQNG